MLRSYIQARKLGSSTVVSNISDNCALTPIIASRRRQLLAPGRMGRGRGVDEDVSQRTRLGRLAVPSPLAGEGEGGGD